MDGIELDEHLAHEPLLVGRLWLLCHVREDLGKSCLSVRREEALYCLCVLRKVCDMRLELVKGPRAPLDELQADGYVFIRLEEDGEAQVQVEHDLGHLGALALLQEVAALEHLL